MVLVLFDVDFAELWVGAKCLGRSWVDSWGCHHGNTDGCRISKQWIYKEEGKEDSCALFRLSIPVQTQGIQMECFLIQLLLYCLSIIMMQ